MKAKKMLWFLSIVLDVPEGGRPFPDMTVHENLEMGAYISETWRSKEEILQKVYQLFPKLKERAGQLERTLRGYVLENGRIVLEEESKKLLENDHVKKAYLGL